MRANNGTEYNSNAAFQFVYNENHIWVQAVYHIVNHNNPPSSEGNFHITIKQQLEDRYR